MSTAVAMQDMHQPHVNIQETGVLRHRPVSKGDTRHTAPTQEQDNWLMSLHDTAGSTLPLDTQSFRPTTTYWVTPHGMLTKEIKILDLTHDLDLPYTGMTDAYKAHVKTTLKDHSFSPVFTVHRGNWIGLKNYITDNQDKRIADWKHPWHSCGEAVLTFPDNSEHSAHPISLTNKRWGFRTEAFTVNSVQFFWEMDSIWHSHNMTLYKVFGSGDNERKVEVGKYAQKWWGGFVTGGTLVVDEKEVDGLVACLTLVVVLKKKRQRAAERHGGGGGGGGGS
ncbi:hypothetical protein K469DRAFT_713048 [Zopfia rhizophila CBS 207.26]|uniref:Uncharacterized protein n=1 Tax=Zopfia rhizophila CBS 207.26 TaxID=1314779 RepID=A0A6A6DVH8_9PEZI|nr:hypothetical protein K469DRAFT_713048 [Zopfia rhizophila CBS 207.26]